MNYNYFLIVLLGTHFFSNGMESAEDSSEETYSSSADDTYFPELGHDTIMESSSDQEQSDSNESLYSDSEHVSFLKAQHKRKQPENKSLQEKKHQCPICFQFYPSNHYLQQHIGFHKGEKPYKCNECGKRFTTSGNRNQHKKRMHKKTVSKEKQLPQKKMHIKTPLEDSIYLPELESPLQEQYASPIPDTLSPLARTVSDVNHNECKHCGLQFAHQEDLLWHQQNVH